MSQKGGNSLSRFCVHWAGGHLRQKITPRGGLKADLSFLLSAICWSFCMALNDTVCVKRSSISLRWAVTPLTLSQVFQNQNISRDEQGPNNRVMMKLGLKTLL